jgi:hypothetical protein
MIATIKRNWAEIKRLMELSQSTEYGWEKYSQCISNGLSNNVLTKKGCGTFIFFVEHLPEYAKLTNEYLKFAKNMNQEQIDFISENRDFLLTIK